MDTPHNPETETPDGLRWSGRRLWESVVTEFELSNHESSLLLQACRTADTLDVLQAHVDVDGPIIDGPNGPRTHPAVIEARACRLLLARLIAAIGLPSGVDDGPKNQRRAVRGSYKIGL